MISKDRKRAVAISRAHAINNPLGMIDNIDFFCFPVSDDVVIYSSVMMFRLHHPLLRTMNEKIRAISESGLLSKWERENTFVVKENVGNNDDKGAKTKDGGDHHGGGGKQMKLKLDHVQGAFTLLCMGIVIAVIAFSFELFASHLMKSRLISNSSHKHKLLLAVEEFLCFA